MISNDDKSLSDEKDDDDDDDDEDDDDDDDDEDEDDDDDDGDDDEDDDDDEDEVCCCCWWRFLDDADEYDIPLRWGSRPHMLGGNLNPAVSLGLALSGKLPWLQMSLGRFRLDIYDRGH